MHAFRYTTSTAFLLLGLLYTVPTVQPAWSQDLATGPILERGLRLGVLGGTCFDAEASSRRCWVWVADLQLYRAGPRRQRGARGFMRHLSLNRSAVANEATALSVRVAASGSTDMLPDKEPPDMGGGKTSRNAVQEDNPPQVRHRGTFAGTFELTLPVAVDPRFIIEPFLGGGIGYVREDEPEMPDRSSIASTSFPVATYGLEVAIRTGNLSRLDLRAQYRGLVYFVNDLEYIAPDGEPFEVNNVKTISSGILLVGFGLRF